MRFQTVSGAWRCKSDQCRKAASVLSMAAAKTEPESSSSNATISRKLLTDGLLESNRPSSDRFIAGSTIVSMSTLDFLQKSGTGNREQGTEADKTEHLQEVYGKH
jgi:hypothetical protein